MNKINYVEKQSERIDNWLSTALNRSRSHIKKCCNDGKILVNGGEVKANYKLKQNDIIMYDLQEEPLKLTPLELPLDIIYEDKDLIIINKPSGLTVHPGAGNKHHTLVNALIYYADTLSDLGGWERPGIIHRLDKDTSGLIVVAKHNEAHQKLATSFKNRQVYKRYLALVVGYLSESKGIINAPIARNPDQYKKFRVDLNKGKEAVTEYIVLKENNEKSFVEVTPKTGRTHQIRVHFAYIGHPLVGDSLYGKKGGKRHLLHAHYLKFIHPISHKELEFYAPAPKWASFAEK